MGSLTTRRAVLLSTAGAWLTSQVGSSGAAARGAICGASMGRGHLVRDGHSASVDAVSERCDVVVVGSGISGLSATWRLAPAGIDVRVLELEDFTGGTSSCGTDGVVPHPWGAHYLPAPNREARATLRLLEQMGTITGFDAAGMPRFDARTLCHAPDERVFYRGRWHSGLVPSEALEPAEREELSRFEAHVESLRTRRGNDGRYWFQIPVAESSRDPEALALDGLSMTDYLAREGFSGPFVHWLVRYATLDDFGAEPEHTSAWAGLHYFASRKLVSEELEGSRYLVWPEGNGRLANTLRELGGARVTTGAVVVNVEERGGEVEVRYVDIASGRLRTILARAAVLAVPAFVAKRLAPGLAERFPTRTSSPWLVANLHVERPLDPNSAWDSVVYGSRGLGYVDASHQLSPPRTSTVLTYFRAFGDGDVRATRSRLALLPWDELATDVFDDLRPAHPELRDQTSRIDLVVWGHAMPRPEPGFLFENARTIGSSLSPRLGWAHTDVTGVALFEEAQRAGVLAAEHVARAAGFELGPTWT